ncbi:UNVERIFIED_CONTAM: hypothetical protein FKN15_069028 [Acipenser sinensis]
MPSRFFPSLHQFLPHGSGDSKVQWVSSDPRTKPLLHPGTRERMSARYRPLEDKGVRSEFTGRLGQEAGFDEKQSMPVLPPKHTEAPESMRRSLQNPQRRPTTPHRQDVNLCCMIHLAHHMVVLLSGEPLRTPKIQSLKNPCDLNIGFFF